MSRPKRVDRPIDKKISIPESVVARIDLELWSDLEQCVPKGAWSKLVTGLLEEWLVKQNEGVAS